MLIHFNRVLGCQGESWKFDPHTQKWDGNPVFEYQFKAYFESLKNRSNRLDTTTQALPMLPKDLALLHAWLDTPEALSLLGKTRCLYFKAFSSLAINLWTR